MDSFSKLMLLLNIIYVIGYGCMLELQLSPAAIMLASADLIEWPKLAPAAWFGPDGRPAADLAASPDQLPAGSADRDAELEAQKKVAAMLAETRDKLAGLPAFEQSCGKCAEFNQTLDEALLELNNFIELESNDDGPVGGRAQDWTQTRGWAHSMLHGEADALRQLLALNAYEKLGSVVSLYSECVAQLGQLGSLEQLDQLLPVAPSMGTLGGVVGEIQARAGDAIQMASLPEVHAGALAKREAGAGAAAHELVRRPDGADPDSEATIEVETGQTGGLMGKLGARASDLFQRAKSLL